MGELDFHHLAVATHDLEGAMRWYADYFGAEPQWETDRLSELTRSRAPGIRRMAELRVRSMRFHVFEVADGGPRPDHWLPGEHYGLQAGSIEELEDYRGRWIDLRESGDYPFREQSAPTEVVTDNDGVASFYARDVAGVEFEVTYVPD